MRLRHVVIVFLLASVYAWAYASVSDAEFVYEDQTWTLAGMPELQAARQLRYSPYQLTAYTFGQMQGASAGWHHVVNLGLHVTVVGLVGWWLLGLGVSANAAWAGSAVVLLHPLAVESVAYVSGRAELITALFVMLACAIVQRKPTWLTIPIAVASGVVAPLGKLPGLAAFILAPMTLVVKRQWHQLGLFFAVACVAGSLYWRLVENAVTYTTTQSAEPLMWARLQATAALHTLGVLLSASGNSVMYDVELVPPWVQWSALWWLPIAGVASVVLWQRGMRFEACGLTWILAIIIPRLIVPTPWFYFNEHQFFLALPGVALIVASLWDRAEVMVEA